MGGECKIASLSIIFTPKKTNTFYIFILVLSIQLMGINKVPFPLSKKIIYCFFIYAAVVYRTQIFCTCHAKLFKLMLKMFNLGILFCIVF